MGMVAGALVLAGGDPVAASARPPEWAGPAGLFRSASPGFRGRVWRAQAAAGRAGDALHERLAGALATVDLYGLFCWVSLPLLAARSCSSALFLLFQACGGALLQDLVGGAGIVRLGVASLVDCPMSSKRLAFLGAWWLCPCVSAAGVTSTRCYGSGMPLSCSSGHQGFADA